MSALSLLFVGCAFVTPEAAPVLLEPSPAVLDAIDRHRRRHQQTAGGAELWRSLDAHGGLLRYERVGPWTAHLADGRTVTEGQPLHDLLTRPFSLVDATASEEVTRQGPSVHVTLDDGLAVSLDGRQLRLTDWTDGAGTTTVETTQPIQGLYLVRSLQRPDGTRVEVSRWEPTDPLPGWPLDSP